MIEYEVERALRDAIGLTVHSGTSEMQRNIVARFLGLQPESWEEQFPSSNPWERTSRRDRRAGRS